jgi:hypothetical protein
MTALSQPGGALETLLSLAPLGSEDYVHFQLSQLEKREARHAADDVTCLDHRGNDSPHQARLFRCLMQPMYDRTRYKAVGLLNGVRAWALAHCVDMGSPCSYKITLKDGSAFAGSCYVTHASIDATAGTFDVELEVLLTPALALTADHGRQSVHSPRFVARHQPIVDSTGHGVEVPEFATVEDLPTAGDFALSFAEA